jgi:hypothetical protein
VLFRIWFEFGFPSFGAVMIILWLMISRLLSHRHLQDRHINRTAPLINDEVILVLTGRNPAAIQIAPSSREQTAKQKIISTFLRSNSKIQWACEISKHGHNKDERTLLHETYLY